jgi:hypothetical protein
MQLIAGQMRSDPIYIIPYTKGMSDSTWHKPSAQEYAIYYLGLPTGLALLFAAFGIRLTVGMPFLDALLYMMLHVMAAWLGIDLGSRCIRWLFRNWQPPAIVNIVIGFFLMIVPLTFYFQWIGDIYGDLYPSFAIARTEEELPSWSLGYLLHFIRFSLPALPMFMAGAFGFRYVTGINWYGYPGQHQIPVKQPAEQDLTDQLIKPEPNANLFAETKLPADAILWALKAEEHYIHIWSDKGTDIIRYRFQDAVDELQQYMGMQVHRSWWVNLNCITACHKQARSLQLTLSGDLTVPVSLAYKQAISNALAQK